MAAPDSAAISRFRTSLASALANSDKSAFDDATKALAVATRIPLSDVLSLPHVQADIQLSNLLNIAADFRWLHPSPTWASILKQSTSSSSSSPPLPPPSTRPLAITSASSATTTTTTTPSGLPSTVSPSHHALHQSRQLHDQSQLHQHRSLLSTATNNNQANRQHLPFTLPSSSSVPTLLSSVTVPNIPLATSSFNRPSTTLGLPSTNSASTDANQSSTTTATQHTKPTRAASSSTTANRVHWYHPSATTQQAFVPPLPSRPVSLPIVVAHTAGGLRPSFRSWKWFGSSASRFDAFGPVTKDDPIDEDEDILSTMRTTMHTQPAGLTVAAAFRAVIPFLEDGQRKTLRNNIAYAEPLQALDSVVNAVHLACGRITNVHNNSKPSTTNLNLQHNKTKGPKTNNNITNRDNNLGSAMKTATTTTTTTTTATTATTTSSSTPTSSSTASATASATTAATAATGIGIHMNNDTLQPVWNGVNNDHLQHRHQQRHVHDNAGNVSFLSPSALNGTSIDTLTSHKLPAAVNGFGLGVWTADGRDVEWNPSQQRPSTSASSLTDPSALDVNAAPFLSHKQS